MITREHFGLTSGGSQVDILRMENQAGMTVDLLTFGATINAIRVPDKNGEFADVLVGFDDVEGNEKLSANQGKTIGRYANRIGNGKFSIDGVEYNVLKNEKGVTCLHGGDELSNVVWKAIVIDDNAVEMSYTSEDGAMGFPGKVDFVVTFTLGSNNALSVKFHAVSDKKTIINMTNHAYFNLSGKGDVLNHILQINADRFTPTDTFSIPTGELRSVEGTAFDFRQPKPIGRDIGADDEQLVNCKGYDHNYLLTCGDGEPAAVAVDPESRRKLEVYTDLPGIQLYTGNFLDGTVCGKGGVPMVKHAGFCLETQFYPDTPNNPSFPQCTFDAGEVYESETLFKFSVAD